MSQPQPQYTTTLYSLCDGVWYLRKLGGVVPAVDGAGTVLADARPHFGRAGDGVHLAGVPRAGGVGRLQRPRGTLSHLLESEVRLRQTNGPHPNWQMVHD